MSLFYSIFALPKYETEIKQQKVQPFFVNMFMDLFSRNDSVLQNPDFHVSDLEV